jgi:hypothetical protein
VGHQPAGHLFVPRQDGPHEDEERPPVTGRPGPPPNGTPERDTTGGDLRDETAAEDGAAGAPADAPPPGSSPSEASQASPRPAGAGPANAPPTGPAPASAGAAGLGPASGELPRRVPGSSRAGPSTPPRPPAAWTPGAPLSRARPAAQPSWGTVLATTIRLWVQRRADIPRWRTALLFVLAVIVVLTGVITITLTVRSPLGNSQASGQRHAQTSAQTSALAAAAAARQRAAAWVAHQVATDAIVACDPAMCAALQAAHVPASQLLVLRSGQADPLGSDVLVATAAVRSQFGSRLTTVYAPVTLAAFGSGTARIEIRAIAPDGAAAYLSQLAADKAARKTYGAQILHNPRIQVSPAARGVLAAGQVDARLLMTLVTMAASHPVDILGFGTTPAPGASPGVPVRSADVTVAAEPGSHHATTLQALRSFLDAQRTPYRPSAVTTVQTASRRTVLRIEYPAPSPLGLLGSPG